MNESLGLFRECIPYFEVLSDETRQKLVLVLGEGHESLNVGAITERVSLSRPAVSHHLKVLLQVTLLLHQTCAQTWSWWGDGYMGPSRTAVTFKSSFR